MTVFSLCACDPDFILRTARSISRIPEYHQKLSLSIDRLSQKPGKKNRMNEDLLSLDRLFWNFWFPQYWEPLIQDRRVTWVSFVPLQVFLNILHFSLYEDLKKFLWQLSNVQRSISISRHAQDLFIEYWVFVLLLDPFLLSLPASHLFSVFINLGLGWFLRVYI